MTHTKKRCGHCGVRYLYQGSGHGCNNPTNDPHHCPDCKQVILDALAQVPRRYEVRRRKISEIPQFAGITLDTVLDWEHRDKERQRAEIARKEARGEFTFPLPLQRIFPGLFDLETGDVMSIRQVPGFDEFQGYSFQLSIWKQKPDYEIRIEAEYDLVHDKYTGALWKIS